MNRTSVPVRLPGHPARRALAFALALVLGAIAPAAATPAPPAGRPISPHAVHAVPGGGAVAAALDRTFALASTGNGDSPARTRHPQTDDAAAAEPDSEPVRSASSVCGELRTRARPRHDYVLHCSGCHGLEGRGANPSVPDLRSMGRFIRLEAGRTFLIRQPLQLASPLSHRRLTAVLNWSLCRFSTDTLPSRFAPFRAAEVRRYRCRPLLDIKRRRRTLLRRLEPRRATDTGPASPSTSGGR